MKKAILASVGALALSFGLVACSEAEAPVEEAAQAPEGLTVSAGRMNVPAAAGNPAAVYFTLTNGGSEDLFLRGAEVAGAQSASLHSSSEFGGQMTMTEVIQVQVPAGETVEFAPGGNHVMVMGLPEGLEPGGEIAVTLSFLRGTEITFQAQLLAPGDDGSGG